MKKTPKVLIALAICSLLCACGNATQDATNPNSTELASTETTIKRYSLENENDKAELLSAMENEDMIYTARMNMYYNSGNTRYSGISVFMNYIEREAPSNNFASELSARYNELQIENKTDLEKDFFEMLPILICNGLGYTEPSGFTINPEEFGKSWIIGYSDKQLSNELPYNARAIFLEIPENTFCEVTGNTPTSENGIIYICYTVYECEDGTLQRDTYFFDYNNFVELTGIDITTDSGICSNNYEAENNKNFPDKRKRWEDIKQNYNGATYNSISDVETKELLSEYFNYCELLKLFVDNKVFSFDVKGYIASHSTEAEPPAIGMTKTEVLNGAWGTPDKKNIDEYEWGTKEQWVYEHHGYVYFEDGIVTAIQYQDEK